MEKLLLLLGAVVVPLVGGIVIRTVRYRSAHPVVAPAPEGVVPAGAAERLAGSVHIPILSPDDRTALNA